MMPLRTRPAIIESYDPKTSKVIYRFVDFDINQRHTTYAPHPFAADGWGIFAGPTNNTLMMMTHAGFGQHAPVSTVPSNAYGQLDVDNSSLLGEFNVDASSYPAVRPGEIVLQSLFGDRIELKSNRIEIINSSETFVSYWRDLKTSAEYFKNKYENTESHRRISGLILRDLREAPSNVDTQRDKLFDASFDSNMAAIGKNPLLPYNRVTTNYSTGSEPAGFRNPALTEHRTLVYECALSDRVGVVDEEIERAKANSDVGYLNEADRRDMQRPDVLNLGPNTPNLLYENIIGTTVDIYGNILDLNRNRIQFPDLDAQASADQTNKFIRDTDLLLRRSIKYHLEINSKKNKSQAGEPKLDGGDDAAIKTGYSHSRFSVDIDGEGLTKINIPASTNTGNIPLLARYVKDVDRENSKPFAEYSHRDKDRLDVRHLGFGGGDGIRVTPKYAPSNYSATGTAQAFVNYRTAYHDIFNIILEDEQLFLNPSIHNDPTDKANLANAGGRSMHANLDGSLEMNVGRDISDNKSILLDTAGSFISHIGRDVRGNSIVTQTDGNVYVQLGGAVSPGQSTPAPSPTFKIYVKTNGNNDTHIISIGEAGIEITSASKTDVKIAAGRDLILSAARNVRTGGSRIEFYGDGTAGTRYLENNGEVIL